MNALAVVPLVMLLAAVAHPGHNQTMDVAIVGAAGTIGRQIAITLLRARVLPPTARLQLVGRRGGPSEAVLPGFAADLADAFAEELPEIDLAWGPDEILADLVIVAAGATVTGLPGAPRDRAALAAVNLPLVEACAKAVARNGHGEELVLVVTNPVEAGVAACCRHLDRRRVIGMGGFLDTLRFRQEIAAELGVRRQMVHGLVLGEHGSRLVPCWSTVRVYGFESEDGAARIAALRRPHDPAPDTALCEIAGIVAREGPAAAYRRADAWGAGLRALVKPLVTQLSGARTPVGSAEMIVRLVATILAGGQFPAAAQVMLDGEFLGIHGVCGAPVVISNRGVERIDALELAPDEAAAVRASVGPP